MTVGAAEGAGETTVAVDGRNDPPPARPPRKDGNDGTTGVTSVPQSPADAEIYRAFISYSHAADRKLAPALQRGLRRLAQPWYRPPVFRVFRDETTLTATPHLWPDIEQAMGSSTFFILMASPAAAASPWVDQEVAWWRAHKPHDQLLIALTEGNLTWDAAASDFDWSVTPRVLPPSLRGAFVREPRWEDLRWARTAERISLRDPRFRSCVAGLAAPMRGAAKDELIDEDVRQSRRAVRWRRTAIAMLVLLTFLAGLSALIAVRQRDTARAQRNTAQARLLLADANSLSQANPRVSLLLSMAAWRAFRLPEARAVLENTMASSHYLATLPTGRNVYCATFRPDGHQLVTGGDDRAATIWRLDTPHHPVEVARLSGHADSVNAVAFTPDGRTLVTASGDRTAIIWNIADSSPGKRLATLTGHKDGVNAVVFSSDGRTLITGSSDQTAIVWNVTDPSRPQQIAMLHGYSDNVTAALAVSRDGRTLVSSGSDGTALAWNIADPAHPQRMTILRAGTANINALAFSPDTRTLVSGSDDGTGTIWNATDPAHPQHLATFAASTAAVRAVAFDSSGQLVATARADGVTTIWNLTQRSSPRPTFNLTSNASSNWSVAFKPASSVVVTGTGTTAGDNDATTLWDLTGDSPVSVAALIGRAQPILAISGDGRVIAAGNSSFVGISIWAFQLDNKLSQETVAFGGSPEESAPETLAFRPNQPILAASTGGMGTVVIWDVANPRHPIRVGSIDEQDGLKTSAVTFSLDGSLLAIGTFSGYVDLLDIRDPRHPTSLGRLAGQSNVTALSFSPGGRTLVAGSSDATATIWDLEKLHRPVRLSMLRGHSGAVRTLAFSPNGRTLVTGSDDTTAVIWDLTHSGRPTRLSTLGEHTKGVSAVTFDPKNMLLVVGSSEGTVGFWDLTDPAHPVRLTTVALGGAVSSLAFRPDGRTLVMANTVSAPQVWDILPVTQMIDTLVERVCSASGVALSHQTWAKYAPGIPYQLSCMPP